MTTPWTIVSGEDSDTDAILELLTGVFAEYGCALDPVIDAPEHYRPHTRYWSRGGAFFVARDTAGRLVATAAVDPAGPQVAQLRTMYLIRAARGTGLAQAMMQSVLDWCRAHGKTRMILWSDTRFTRGHAFYRKMGFHQTDDVRELHDINNSQEYYFEAEVDELVL